MKKLFALLLALALACTCVACSGTAKAKKLVVGASPTPHAEILTDVVAPLLAKEGITLEVQIFTDYVLPNTALDEGDLDANYFQHLPYLLDFNAKNGTKLASVAAVHYEPMGIFAGKSSDLANVPDGATIAVPNDTTNEARALWLLAANGIIEVRADAGLEATVLDISANPHNVEILELEAAQIPRTLEDVDFAIVNGNYAQGAGISDAPLTTEGKDSEGAQTYANIIAVREGDESRPEIQALVKAIQSDEVRAYIQENYGSVNIPVF